MEEDVKDTEENVQGDGQETEEQPQDELQEPEGLSKKKSLSERVVFWILCLVNVGLVLLILYNLIPTIMYYHELRGEEQYLEQGGKWIEDTQAETEESREFYASSQEEYEAVVEERQEAVWAQLGRSYDYASDIASDILYNLSEPDEGRTEILQGDVSAQEDSYWVEWKTDDISRSKEQQVCQINVYHGVSYEHEKSRLLQTLVMDLESAPVYLTVEDYNFDGFRDIALNCSIRENGEELLQEGYMIYLWDDYHKELTYCGHIIAAQIVPSEKEHVLYCSETYGETKEYKLWKIEHGELRYLGMKGEVE